MSRRLAIAAVTTLALGAALAPATSINAAPAPAAAITRAAVPNFPGILVVGSRGPAVTAVQKGLLRQHYGISGLSLRSSSRKFGVLTAQTMVTIMRYKAAHNLGPSRAVGPKT